MRNLGRFVAVPILAIGALVLGVAPANAAPVGVSGPSQVTEGNAGVIPDGSPVLASSATAGDAEAITLPDGQGEVGGLSDVTVPWLVADTPSGVAVVWGNALDAEDPADLSQAVSVSSKPVAKTSTTGARTQSTQATAAASGFCTFLISRVDYNGGINKLYGSSLATCTGAHPGYIETLMQIRRSSWTGFRNYTVVYTSPRALGYTQDRGFSTACANGSGTYDYQMNGRVNTATYGQSPWHQSDVANQHSCGTGVS
jgi:hypothetical protein